MIRRLFAASSSITSAAIVLGLSGLLSRLLGVYRDRLLASTFGASATLDAYYAAFRIPDFVFNIIVLGALSAGFIPVFTQYMAKSKEKAWNLAQSSLVIVSCCVMVLGLVLYVTAPWLMQIIAPGFSPENVDLATRMTRVMLLSPIILGMSSVFGGVLQSFKRFLAYSLAPIFYNVGIIVGIAVFVPLIGPHGLAWGVVAGSIMHLLMQAFVAMRLGWSWQAIWPWKTEGIREILGLMGPRTLSLAISEANLFIVTSLASGLSAGSLAMFTFAHNLAHVPIGLIGISFAVAAFPILSSYAGQGRMRKFIKTQEKTVSAILFFLMPILVVFVLLDEQIVRLVLGSGAFDWTSTLTTARTLLFLTPHMFCQTLIPLYTRSYYARKNSVYPLYAALCAVLVNVVAAYYLTARLGITGLALSLGLASTFQLLFLLTGAEVRGRYFTKTRVRITMLQTFISGCMMAFVLQMAKFVIGPALDLLTVRGVLVHMIVPSAVGLTVYLLALKAQRSEEYKHYETLFQNKLRHVLRPFVPVVGAGEEDDLMKH